METSPTFQSITNFLMALAFTQPRILGLFVVVPVFNQSLLPGMLRYAVAVGIGVMAAPPLLGQVAAMDFQAGQVLAIVVKEAAVGFVLGCLIAVPFWAFEGVGFLIDNQRGASIGATLNPLTGNDSSPMGILFNQAFIVFFFIVGGFTLMLQLVYDSFRLWNVFDWYPHLRAESSTYFIDALMGLVKLALLLAAPAIVAMFLAELGLALVSGFVPQLQVFFLAMPIKSALAVLVLMLYVAVLFDYGADLLRPLRELLPTLDGHWRAPEGVKR